MTDITPIIDAVIALLLSVLTVFVIPAIKKFVNKAEYEKMYGIIYTAVRAAEQIFKLTHPEGGVGKAKKEYVLNYLHERGYNIDDEQVNMIIEAAVLELNQAVKGV